MNLLIRADSSSQIGIGHIMRDLVLARRYPEDTVTFTCQNLPGNILERIPYPVHLLATNEPQELIDLIRTEKIDMVVFDHYGIDAAYEKKVKDETGVTVLSVDDTYLPHHCDTLLNPNVYADPSRYASLVPHSCELRCGKEFLLVREEFYRVKNTPKPKSERIFVAMGGSDPQGLSLRILSTLPPNRAIDLLTTSANPRLDALRDYAATHSNVTLHVDAPDVAALMHRCGCAIITPSSIAHEAITMELPFVAIQSAPNQSEFVRYLKKSGYPVLERFDPERLLSSLDKLPIRLIPFGDLSPEDSDRVLRWRNHPDVRTFMYTDREISPQEHQNFIATLNERRERRYFLVCSDDTPIGVIDLTGITDTSAHIGLYADPEHPRPGTGGILMRSLVDYAINALGLSRLYAECFSDNPRAKHLYEKFDFTETNRDIRNGREIIIMERSNADR